MCIAASGNRGSEQRTIPRIPFNPGNSNCSLNTIPNKLMSFGINWSDGQWHNPSIHGYRKLISGIFSQLLTANYWTCSWLYGRPTDCACVLSVNS